MYYLYILQSLKDGNFYIGQTSNLEDRVIRHNSGREKSTRNRKPFVLVYTEKFMTRNDAIKRERYLKSLKSHNSILDLIRNNVEKRGGSSTG